MNDKGASSGDNTIGLPSNSSKTTQNLTNSRNNKANATTSVSNATPNEKGNQSSNRFNEMNNEGFKATPAKNTDVGDHIIALSSKLMETPNDNKANSNHSDSLNKRLTFSKHCSMFDVPKNLIGFPERNGIIVNTGK